MTTQMSFNPSAVLAWMTQVRRDHVLLPIHLGIPGAVPLPRLMAIASRIGVAESSRYLLKHRSLLGHLLHGGTFGPDAFLFDVARALIQPATDVRALHIFTMNEVAATVDWQRRMTAELGSSPASG
jgi:methylenetetrahydrofolate reductase (NADPH)